MINHEEPTTDGNGIGGAATPSEIASRRVHSDSAGVTRETEQTYQRLFFPKSSKLGIRDPPSQTRCRSGCKRGSTPAGDEVEGGEKR